MEKEQSGKQSFWEIVRFALIAIAIVIPVRTLVAQPFVVSGSSKIPTFEDAQYLIIDEISYRFSEPKRGQVIVFKYPNDTKKFFIKRIIGLPNETVDIKGDIVIIKNEENPDGFVLSQEYVKNHANSETHFELKADEYFVMGDNRSASSDSRYWGAVNRKLIIGRPFVRLLPFSKMETFPGNYKYDK
ncbi:MAG: signal peptidase I [Patescibacteria group bacterium]